MRRAWLWWSSGKDSAWTLHTLRSKAEVEVTRLLTTVNQEFERVAMHAVRLELLHRQARATGVDLGVVDIPNPCSNDEYAHIFQSVVGEAVRQGVELMAFGDLFLEDVRAYREGLLDGTGIEPLFPLWGFDTGRLARDMIQAGLKAKITCVDPKVLPKGFAGREFDAAFVDDLPEDVDPCGERGEFHSFAWAGPMFSFPIPCTSGETVEREGFVFTDVLPK